MSGGDSSPPDKAPAQVWVWGRGEYGRLGLGDRSGSSKLRPQRLESLLGQYVVEVSCGGTHTICLTAEGRIFVSGRADYGRLGQGEKPVKDAYSPIEIELPGGAANWRVITVAGGGRHSMILALPVRGEEEDGALGPRQQGHGAGDLLPEFQALLMTGDDWYPTRGSPRFFGASEAGGTSPRNEAVGGEAGTATSRLGIEEEDRLAQASRRGPAWCTRAVV